MGVGFGGFVDGIVLHQIVQWHHMISSTSGNSPRSLVGLETNTVADGFFHLSTWIFVLLGVTLTVRAWQSGKFAPPWRAHTGMLLTGWGIFNLVEGVVDHQILGVHHVRDDLGAPLGWDIGFLVFGASLLLVGLLLVRSAQRDSSMEPQRTN